MHRQKLLTRVADHVIAGSRTHPTRVAVDGVTAAGKTTFAAELAASVRSRGRAAIHLTTDDFHHQAAHRHRDADSARGYYRDAYDLDAFRRLVLDPLGPSGDRRYRQRSHDLHTDDLVDEPPVTAVSDAVVVVDGSFLQSAALAGGWDEVVWLDTGFDSAAARGSARDAALFGGEGAAREAFASRYHAAARLYLDDVDPMATATIVVGNDDVADPALMRIGGRADDTAQLFSYGTLQQANTQLAIFGRELAGSPDSLPGFRLDRLQITDPDVVTASGSDRHPIARPGSAEHDAVPGTVLTLSTAELAVADTYEVDDYRRVPVRLASGTDAWLYVAQRPPIDVSDGTNRPV